MPAPEALTLAQKLVLLAVMGGVGAVGTLARYGLSSVLQKPGGEGFPWGTFVVNALGCLLFGLIYELAEGKRIISTEARLVALTGFMGAFTTFSTFAFESAEMLRAGNWITLAANLIGQNALGIACVVAGMAAGRAL